MMRSAVWIAAAACIVAAALLGLPLTGPSGASDVDATASPAADGDPDPVSSAVALLPDSAGVAGWARSLETTGFAAVDLWQHIDGAADQYLAFGCRSLAVGYYEPVAGQGQSPPEEQGEGAGHRATHGVPQSEIAVEIYGMADHLGSFGIYMLERPPVGPFLDIGAQGYQSGADLNFFGGPFYIKLNVYPDGEEQRAAARRMAEIISATHLAGSGFPKELDLFPPENLVAEGFGFVPRSVLGLSELRNALVAEYRGPRSDPVETLKLHLMRASDARSAEATFKQAAAALAQRGTKALTEVSFAEAKGVRTEMQYRGPVLMLLWRNFIVLGVGPIEEEWAAAAVAALLARLPR